MKHLRSILSTVLALCLLVLASTIIQSCDGDDDEAPALTLASLNAEVIDLNASTSATGVPVDANIVAEFSTAVDPSSTSAITLTRQVDGVAFPVTATVSGKTVTIDPTDNFSTGTLFILNFGAGLKSDQGKV